MALAAACVALDVVVAIKLRMSVITIGTLGTKAQGVVLAQHFGIVPVATRAAVLAKAASIELTQLLALLVRNVEVQAVIVGAFAVLSEKVALGHLAHVVLVQKLARLALFAQATQPMLAHHRTVILH